MLRHCIMQGILTWHSARSDGSYHDWPQQEHLRLEGLQELAYLVAHRNGSFLLTNTKHETINGIGFRSKDTTRRRDEGNGGAQHKRKAQLKEVRDTYRGCERIEDSEELKL